MVSVLRAVCDLQIILVPRPFPLSRCFQRRNKAVKGKAKTVQDVTLRGKKKKEIKGEKKKVVSNLFAQTAPCDYSIYQCLSQHGAAPAYKE